MSVPLNYQLLEAVKQRDHDLVKKLLDQGAQVNGARNQDGYTCLLLASSEFSFTKYNAQPPHHVRIRQDPDIEMVKLLLEAGADATAVQSWEENSCLHLAAKFDQTGELTKILLQAGAKSIINDRNTNGSSPLRVAVARGDELLNKSLIVKLLVDAGAKLSRSICSKLRLWRENDNEVLRILLEASGAGAVINSPDEKFTTPFQEAVRYSRIDRVKQMIDLGANVNFISPQDHREGTPLHIAAHLTFPNKVNLLLEHGADPDALNNQGESVIAVAARNFMPCRIHKDLMKALLLHRKTEDGSVGCARLKTIVQYGSVEALQFHLSLVREGLIRQKSNESLLFAASMNENHPMIHHLLDEGISQINEKYENNWTALHKLAWHHSAVAAPSQSSERYKSRQFFRAIGRLIQSIALLESMKYRIDPSIFEAIKQDVTYQSFYERCVIELHNLQCHTIDGPITYYSIVAKDRIIAWVRNKRVVEALEVLDKSSESLSRTFPIYHIFLILNSREGRNRSDLMQKAVQGLQSLIRIDSDTFSSVYERIFHYLNNEDLCDLSKIVDL